MLIALLLMTLFVPVFSVWSQRILVSVTGLDGQPVVGALVGITYQKDNSLSQSDGLISGKTGSNGTFEAELANSVPMDYQNRNVLVNVSTFFWAGEKRSVLADSPNVKKVAFAAPFSVEFVTVRVLDSRNEPVNGAEVKMDGENAGRLTGSTGEWVVQVPVGSEFGGIASYGNASARFNSSQASQKVITVALQLLSEGNGTAANGFSVQIEDSTGKPVAEQELNVSFAAENREIKVYNLKTDTGGNALLMYDGNGTLNVSFRLNEHEYAYQFNVSGSERRKIALEPLLKISSFEKETLPSNRYKLYANVTDLRTSIPIEVKMVLAGRANRSLAVQATEPGVFTSSICVDSSSQAQALASDRYETAESALLNLTYAVPYTPPPLPPIQPKKQGIEPWMVVAGGALLIVIVLAGGIYIIRKRKSSEEQPESGEEQYDEPSSEKHPAAAPVEKVPIDAVYQLEKFLRPITVYVRRAVELLTKKRRRKPPTPIPPAVG